MQTRQMKPNPTQPQPWLWLSLAAAIIPLLLFGCYWQPSEKDRTGNLSLTVTIPASPNRGSSMLSAQAEGEPDGMVLLMLFNEQFFTGPNRNDNLQRLFSDGDDGLLRIDLEGGEPPEPEGMTVEDVLNTSFTGLLRYHWQFLYPGEVPGGSITFDGLPEGVYTLFGFGGYFETDPFMGMTRATVTVSEEDSAPTRVSLELSGDASQFLDFLVTQYSVPIADLHPAGGHVSSTNEGMGWDFTGFSVGGLAREYRGRVGDTAHRHHLYIFEPGTQFNFEGTYNPNEPGSGRINGTGKSFIEIVVVTEEWLLEDWTVDAENYLMIEEFHDTTVPRIEYARVYSAVDNAWERLDSGYLTLADDYTYPYVTFDFYIDTGEGHLNVNSVSYGICFDDLEDYDPEAEASGMVCGEIGT